MEIPFEKIVQQSGNSAPSSATFQFELYDFGASGDYRVSGNAVSTNGTGTFSGSIVIEVPENDLGNLSEGFWVREVNDGKVDWSYAPETWFVQAELAYDATQMPQQVGVWIRKAADENQFYKTMTFTNVYTYNEVYYDPTPIPTPAPQIDLPQTGDNGMLAFGIALLLLAAATCMATLCAKKH